MRDVKVFRQAAEETLRGWLPQARAREQKLLQLPKAGETMPDRSVCVGMSPETGRPLFVSPESSSYPMMFSATGSYVTSKQGWLGYRDWRLPTREELALVWQQRNAPGLSETFNAAVTVADCYWSSTPDDPDTVFFRRFSDGLEACTDRRSRMMVRMVR